jgi:lysophospholipase L1-like esterase
MSRRSLQQQDTLRTAGDVPALARSFGRRLQFVSAYQSAATDFGTNQASGISFRHTHKMTVAASDVRLVLPLGFKVTPLTSGSDVLGPAAVPFKGSIELAGVIRPLLFGGVRQKSNDPGGVIITDPIAADFTAGTLVPVRCFHNVTTGQPYPNTNGTGQGPGASATGDGFSPGSDITDALTAVGIASTTNFVPHGLIGVPATPQPSIAGIGDSIILGTGDSALNGGFLARATNATVPLLRIAVGGNTAQGIAISHSYSWSMVEYCTHAVVMLGANDGMTPRTFAQFQADMTTIFTALRNRGLKVYACTITPRTNAGNTAAAATFFNAGAGSGRGQSNAWIRAGAGGLIDGYFETSDPVESSRDSGFWISTAYTTDGAHPTTLGHTAMAANVNIASLT